MSVADSMNPGDLSGSHVKIGTPSHMGRNVGMAIGVLALGGGIAWFTMHGSKADTANLVKLDAFRAAYAAKCEAPSWKGEAPPMLRDTYLRSTRLQEAVDKQAAALASGTACEDVLKALKGADYPLPSAQPAAQ
jgi:hypothetical protein